MTQAYLGSLYFFTCFFLSCDSSNIFPTGIGCCFTHCKHWPLGRILGSGYNDKTNRGFSFACSKCSKAESYFPSKKIKIIKNVRLYTNVNIFYSKIHNEKDLLKQGKNFSFSPWGNLKQRIRNIHGDKYTWDKDWMDFKVMYCNWAELVIDCVSSHKVNPVLVEKQSFYS